MGRQARLKKNRQDSSGQSQPPDTTEPTQFVKQIQQQGYNLKQAQRSPELPDDRPEPQV
ncbi:hypothetical protein [Oscillatoria sp. FACHB-1406]|uniref:hypothetical protein n=1 Tax=Oscillatoria sp. FACHB-1406 TaxID=2692846 RepID=UPI001685F79A|nr:hypothetical protein [Oscillatoria sp. FACHB-1406]MBD2576811.1 hypothetical protein [Oscillatoria sp. FACHB-1406]